MNQLTIRAGTKVTINGLPLTKLKTVAISIAMSVPIIRSFRSGVFEVYDYRLWPRNQAS